MMMRLLVRTAAARTWKQILYGVPIFDPFPQDQLQIPYLETLTIATLI
jgi:hypothetical protein